MKVEKEYVRNTIAELMDIAPEEITDTESLFLEIGMDSMILMDLLYTIEKEYDICIDRTVFRADTNLNGLMDILRKSQGEA